MSRQVARQHRRLIWILVPAICCVIVIQFFVVTNSVVKTTATSTTTTTTTTVDEATTSSESVEKRIIAAAAATNESSPAHNESTMKDDDDDDDDATSPSPLPVRQNVLFPPPSSSSPLSVATTNTTTTTKTTTPTPGNLFICGWDNTGLAKHLFPEYTIVGEFQRDTISTSNDILLHGMHGPCAISSNYEDYFNGTILFVNGEPFGRIAMMPKRSSGNSTNTTTITTKNRVFQMGGPVNKSESFPFDPESNIVRVYFAAKYLLSRPQYQWQQIFDPSQRPRFVKPSIQQQETVQDTPMTMMIQNNTGNDDNTNTTTTTTPATTTTTTTIHTYNNNNITNSTTNTSRLSPPLPPRPRRSKLIYVSRKCLPHRQSAVEHLSTVLDVDYGGTCGGYIRSNSKNNNNNNNNNVIHKIESTNIPPAWNTNFELYSNYPYCMVMENSNVAGYISEKIILAYLAGCIPIYWGTNEIFDIFNPNSFLFYNNDPQDDDDDILNKIIYLEQNQTAFDEMLQAPILLSSLQRQQQEQRQQQQQKENGIHTTTTNNNNNNNGATTTTTNSIIDEYFSLTNAIGNGSLKQRIRKMMGIQQHTDSRQYIDLH